ncbi:uncharacterized protein LOC108680648, partial [Hyalella azteca]|uniref:Uncharacterized protein LOC108680648 n=1 Tax=Hyalella azteca TaxID=294128 RepID=A0A8B7PFU6_HYAAZ
YGLETLSEGTWKRWRLLINATRLSDAGAYRCRVATSPPIVFDVTLKITAPRARIVDERGADVSEKHYNSGSLIQLKCHVDRVPFPSGRVTWRKADTVLTFNTSIGGISVKGEPATGLVTSRLYVANASPRDSGTYSCWYEDYAHDNVTVHVIAGEYPAAMQDDSLTDSGAANSNDNSSSSSSAAAQHFAPVCCTLLLLTLPQLQSNNRRHCRAEFFVRLSLMAWAVLMLSYVYKGR